MDGYPPGFFPMPAESEGLTGQPPGFIPDRTSGPLGNWYGMPFVPVVPPEAQHALMSHAQQGQVMQHPVMRQPASELNAFSSPIQLRGSAETSLATSPSLLTDDQTARLCHIDKRRDSRRRSWEVKDQGGRSASKRARFTPSLDSWHLQGKGQDGTGCQSPAGQRRQMQGQERNATETAKKRPRSVQQLDQSHTPLRGGGEQKSPLGWRAPDRPRSSPGVRGPSPFQLSTPLWRHSSPLQKSSPLADALKQKVQLWQTETAGAIHTGQGEQLQERVSNTAEQRDPSRLTSLEKRGGDAALLLQQSSSNRDAEKVQASQPVNHTSEAAGSTVQSNAVQDSVSQLVAEIKEYVSSGFHRQDKSQNPESLKTCLASLGSHHDADTRSRSSIKERLLELPAQLEIRASEPANVLTPITHVKERLSSSTPQPANPGSNWPQQNLTPNIGNNWLAVKGHKSPVASTSTSLLSGKDQKRLGHQSRGRLQGREASAETGASNHSQGAAASVSEQLAAKQLKDKQVWKIPDKLQKLLNEGLVKDPPPVPPQQQALQALNLMHGAARLSKKQLRRVKVQAQESKELIELQNAVGMQNVPVIMRLYWEAKGPQEGPNQGEPKFPIHEQVKILRQVARRSRKKLGKLRKKEAQQQRWCQQRWSPHLTAVGQQQNPLVQAEERAVSPVQQQNGVPVLLQPAQPPRQQEPEPQGQEETFVEEKKESPALFVYASWTRPGLQSEEELLLQAASQKQDDESVEGGAENRMSPGVENEVDPFGLSSVPDGGQTTDSKRGSAEDPLKSTVQKAEGQQAGETVRPQKENVASGEQQGKGEEGIEDGNNQAASGTASGAQNGVVPEALLTNGGRNKLQTEFSSAARIRPFPSWSQKRTAAELICPHSMQTLGEKSLQTEKSLQKPLVGLLFRDDQRMEGSLGNPKAETSESRGRAEGHQRPHTDLQEQRSAALLTREGAAAVDEVSKESANQRPLEITTSTLARKPASFQADTFRKGVVAKGAKVPSSSSVLIGPSVPGTPKPQTLAPKTSTHQTPAADRVLAELRAKALASQRKKEVPPVSKVAHEQEVSGKPRGQVGTEGLSGQVAEKPCGQAASKVPHGQKASKKPRGPKKSCEQEAFEVPIGTRLHSEQRAPKVSEVPHGQAMSGSPSGGAVGSLQAAQKSTSKCAQEGALRANETAPKQAATRGKATGATARDHAKEEPTAGTEKNGTAASVGGKGTTGAVPSVLQSLVGTKRATSETLAQQTPSPSPKNVTSGVEAAVKAAAKALEPQRVLPKPIVAASKPAPAGPKQPNDVQNWIKAAAKAEGSVASFQGSLWAGTSSPRLAGTNPTSPALSSSFLTTTKTRSLTQGPQPGMLPLPPQSPFEPLSSSLLSTLPALSKVVESSSTLGVNPGFKAPTLPPAAAGVKLSSEQALKPPSEALKPATQTFQSPKKALKPLTFPNQALKPPLSAPAPILAAGVASGPKAVTMPAPFGAQASRPFISGALSGSLTFGIKAGVNTSSSPANPKATEKGSMSAKADIGESLSFKPSATERQPISVQTDSSSPEEALAATIKALRESIEKQTQQAGPPANEAPPPGRERKRPAYIKKRKNVLVRRVTPGKNSMKVEAPALKAMPAKGKLVRKTPRKKALSWQRTSKAGDGNMRTPVQQGLKSSRVFGSPQKKRLKWTKGGPSPAPKQSKRFVGDSFKDPQRVGVHKGREGPGLVRRAGLKWTRQGLKDRTPRKSIGGRSRTPILKSDNKGSLLNLFRQLRGQRTFSSTYSKSTSGLSLKRTGAVGVRGNLRWTLSSSKKRKAAIEEAVKASGEEKEATPSAKRRRVLAAARATARSKRASVMASLRRKPGAALPNRERVIPIGPAKYKMDSQGRSLIRVSEPTSSSAFTPPPSTPKRASVNGRSYVRHEAADRFVVDPASSRKVMASGRLKWSLQNARRRKAQKEPKLCSYFTKFGKCTRESGRCPFVHDPDKVAICTKFVLGRCGKANCTLTHKIIPERMPICSYFLEGTCTNEKCPFRHVSVSPEAPVCRDFLRGFCPRGDRCPDKHASVCPRFASDGQCEEGDKCRFYHPTRRTWTLARALKEAGRKRKRARKAFPTPPPDLGEGGIPLPADDESESDAPPQRLRARRRYFEQDDPKVAHRIKPAFLLEES